MPCRRAGDSETSRSIGTSYELGTATETRGDAAFAAKFTQPCGDLLQHTVTGGMPEQIVDLFEAVKIETEERHLHPRFGTGGQFAVDDLLELHAVRHAGEGVVSREKAQALLAATRSRDILVGTEPPAAGNTDAEYADFALIGQTNDHRGG